MLKLIEKNKKSTVYKVIDTETGEISKFNRKNLMLFSANNKVQGVDVKYEQTKVIKPNDLSISLYYFCSFLGEVFGDATMFMVKSNVKDLPLLDVKIHTLNSEEDILFSKMFYTEYTQFKQKLYYTKDENILNIYTEYDRIVVSDKSSFFMYDEDIECKSILNPYKFVRYNGEPIFRVFEEVL